jgi:hypothetical protein
MHLAVHSITTLPLDHVLLATEELPQIVRVVAPFAEIAVVHLVGIHPFLADIASMIFASVAHANSTSAISHGLFVSTDFIIIITRILQHIFFFSQETSK